MSNTSDRGELVRLAGERSCSPGSSATCCPYATCPPIWAEYRLPPKGTALLGRLRDRQQQMSMGQSQRPPL